MRRVCRYFRARPRLVSILLAAIYIMTTALYHLFNKPPAVIHCLHIPLDNYIVFSPPWIFPYLAWYIFLPAVGFSLMFRDRRQYTATILTMILGLLLSFLIYTLYQTVVPRPPVPGDDVISQLVRLIYAIDEPYNGFPSIHVLITHILTLGVTKARNFTKTAKAATWAAGWLIILSTVFVKQHVVLDIVGGLALGQLLHWLQGRFLHRFPQLGGDVSV